LSLCQYDIYRRSLHVFTSTTADLDFPRLFAISRAAERGNEINKSQSDDGLHQTKGVQALIHARRIGNKKALRLFIGLVVFDFNEELLSSPISVHCRLPKKVLSNTDCNLHMNADITDQRGFCASLVT